MYFSKCRCFSNTLRIVKTLPCYKLRKIAVVSDQLVISAVLDDFALAERDNPVVSTVLTSILQSVTQARNTATAASNCRLPDSITVEKIILFILSRNRPMSNTAKVAAPMSTKSETDSVPMI